MAPTAISAAKAPAFAPPRSLSIARCAHGVSTPDAVYGHGYLPPPCRSGVGLSSVSGGGSAQPASDDKATITTVTGTQLRLFACIECFLAKTWSRHVGGRRRDGQNIGRDVTRG